MLGGSILSMLAFFVAANRRAQRLSENAEDLHGSARLARPKDIEATGLAQAERRLCRWLVQRLDPPAAIPPSQRPGTCSRVCAHPVR